VGFIYAVALMGSFFVIALPGGILAFLLGRRSKRTPTFWVAAALTAAAVIPLRMYMVFEPYLSTGAIPIWTGRVSAVLGIPLFVTALLAGIGLVAAYRMGARFGETMLGAAAGLGASLPLQVFIATAWFTELAGLAGLRVSY
jgi:hypothetical protein